MIGKVDTLAVSTVYALAVRRVSGAVVLRDIQLDIELAVGTVALRAEMLVCQLADMWAGHWVAWRAARMVGKRVGRKAVQKVP